MPQPFDYTIKGTPDPTEQVLSGYRAGAKLTALREGRAASEVARQKKSELDTRIAGLSASSSSEDWLTAAAAASELNPDYGKQIAAAYEGMNKEQRETNLRDLSQVASAISINPQIGIDMAREKATAFRNSGLDQEAEDLDILANMIEANPDMAMNTLRWAAASLPGEAGREVIGTMLGAEKTEAETEGIVGEEERAEELQPLVVEKAEAEISKLKAERDEILGEIESSGKPTPEQIIKGEDSTKAVYDKRTEDYQLGQRQLTNMKAAAEDRSGPGDIALIRSFLLMLEPNSVVRESEFATAAEAQGYVKKLGMTLEKLQEGKILNNNARANFLELAGKFIHHGKQKAEQEFWFASDKADRRGLDKRNIFTEKDLVLFDRKGRPNPEDYKFIDSDISEMVSFLENLNDDLDTQDSGQPSYLQFKSIKEDE